MSIRERYDKLSSGLKLLALVPPAVLAIVAILAFADDQLPATRARVERVELRVDTLGSEVKYNRGYNIELYAQQRQMLCLQEDQEPGRAERCLIAYQDAKREGIQE